MSGYDMLAVVLIVCAVLDWMATAVLIRGAMRLQYVALRERAGVSAILSVLASAVAVMGVVYLLDLSIPILSAVVIIGVFLGISVPQLLWGIDYLRGRFDVD